VTISGLRILWWGALRKMFWNYRRVMIAQLWKYTKNSWNHVVLNCDFSLFLALTLSLFLSLSIYKYAKQKTSTFSGVKIYAENFIKNRPVYPVISVKCVGTRRCGLTRGYAGPRLSRNFSKRKWNSQKAEFLNSRWMHLLRLRDHES
jgi:hypothetical protein